MHTVYFTVFTTLFLSFCSSHVIYSSRTRRQSPRQAQCPIDQHTCINGDCIETFSVCDGTKDCRDGSDETLATCSKISIQCPPFSFRCSYGACVDRSAKCDGKQDCADNSDELLPECKKALAADLSSSSQCLDGQFRCTSGECIDEFSTCDGTADCADESDESISQCINIRCPPYTFRCAYGGCIDKNKKCNKVKDCSDGSDEDPELCRNIIPSKKPPPTTKKPTTPRPTPDPDSGKCVLPELPIGGTYTLNKCPGSRQRNCKPVPGTNVDSDTFLKFECKEGYVLPENAQRAVCLNGVWDPEIPKCLKVCKPLISSSVDILCIYRGDNVSCENPMRPGTKVNPQCKRSYHEGDPSATFKEAVCLPDGEWSSPMFRCIPDCGKPSFHVQETLISHGVNATSGEYPWHVGLYLLETATNKFEQSCGGTLVSPHIVITAAHCVYLESEMKNVDVNNLKVAAGKLHRSWYIQDPKQQTRDVREILKPEKYEGSSTSYAQDIAILDLVSSFILNDILLPACIDRGVSNGLYYTPSRGTLGTAVGWGLTEQNISSETLLYADLPYLEYEECLKKSSASFRRFITYDKFCAGYANGTGVQKGDSGGGLTFKRLGLYFVYGVVSVKPKSENTFAVFTNVSEHSPWIDKAMNAFRYLHPQ